MPRKVDLTVRTSAPADKVWDAWTDPSRLAGWLLDRAAGEPEPGASYEWHWEPGDTGQTLVVREAAPQQRLVIDFPAPGQLLEITLHREGGDTEVHLVNSGFRDGDEWEDEFIGFRNGWTFCLEILKVYLEMYWGRRRRLLAIFRPAQFEYTRLAELYRQPGGWLSLGMPIPTRILASAGREVCYGWDEIEGILELKSFESPGGRMLGLRAISWAAEDVLVPMKLPAEASRFCRSRGRRRLWRCPANW